MLGGKSLTGQMSAGPILVPIQPPSTGVGPTGAAPAGAGPLGGALGLVTALLSPGLFKMNGAPAASPGQAVGVLMFLLIFGLLINTTSSAAGAGIWLGVRRWVLHGKTSGPAGAG